MKKADLKNAINTVVVVMLENRSFDNMLGYLRHPGFGGRHDVDGLVSVDCDDYANIYKGEPYFPFRKQPDEPLLSDSSSRARLRETTIGLS